MADTNSPIYGPPYFGPFHINSSLHTGALPCLVFAAGLNTVWRNYKSKPKQYSSILLYLTTSNASPLHSVEPHLHIKVFGWFRSVSPGPLAVRPRDQILLSCQHPWGTTEKLTVSCPSTNKSTQTTTIKITTV